MVSRWDIKAVKDDLTIWLDRQPGYVRAIGANVIGSLNAAVISAYVHPEIKKQLAADVEKLRFARAQTPAGVTRTSSD